MSLDSLISTGREKMKTMYYLASTIGSTDSITHELEHAGVKNWCIHIISNDESGIRKRQLHSSNYLETLDLLRDGIIGGVIGLSIGLIAVSLLISLNPLGMELPGIIYFFIVALLTLFGLWEGGLAGIASKNKKLAKFEKDLADGKYLILIYTSKKNHARIQYIMDHKFPGVKLAAEDSHFLNPFSSLEHS